MKTLELAPAATVTDAGAESRLFTVVRAILAPPARAGFVSVTVHVLAELGARVLGLQVKEDTRTGATSVMVVLAELLL